VVGNVPRPHHLRHRHHHRHHHHLALASVQLLIHFATRVISGATSLLHLVRTPKLVEANVPAVLHPIKQHMEDRVLRLLQQVLVALRDSLKQRPKRCSTYITNFDALSVLLQSNGTQHSSVKPRTRKTKSAHFRIPIVMISQFQVARI
jgi:hypothetical protein